MNQIALRQYPAAIGHKVRVFAGAHKFWAVIIIALVLYGGYRTYAALTAVPVETHYVTATVATGTVVAALTETGQVSASQQLTLSPQASGQVVGVYVTPGQQVYAGQTIAQLDATDALQSLQSAKLSLATAQLTYNQDTATSTLQLNLVNAQSDATNAQIALTKAHDNAYASLASIYTDLSTVVTGLDSVLHNSNVASRPNQQNIDAYANLVSNHDDSIGVYANTAETTYNAAYTAYQNALTAYQATNNSISDSALQTLAEQTYNAAAIVAQATRAAHDFYNRVSSDYSLYNLGTSSQLSTLLANTDTYSTTITTDLSNALSAKGNLVSAEQSLAQAQNALQVQQSGANTLTVQQAALNLKTAQDAVTTAEQNLSDYTVTAPFSGTIASVGVQKFDQAGPSTQVAVLVTNKATANITVNEVDASKLKIGQNATLTFDALPNLTIAGTVASINEIGTVTQGVVSYNATIAFDTNNAQVKPGMSVTANIITGTETGLVVPASAINTSGNTPYVQVFSPPLANSAGTTGAPSAVPPKDVPVVTGLSDDTQAIIESGLSAGDQVVTRTIAGSSAPSAAAQSTSLIGGGRPGGGARPAGGAFRALGG